MIRNPAFEALHPRDRNGQFIKKFSLIEVLNYLRPEEQTRFGKGNLRGRVSQVLRNRFIGFEVDDPRAEKEGFPYEQGDVLWTQPNRVEVIEEAKAELPPPPIEMDEVDFREPEANQLVSPAERVANRAWTTTETADPSARWYWAIRRDDSGTDYLYANRTPTPERWNLAYAAPVDTDNPDEIVEIVRSFGHSFPTTMVEPVTVDDDMSPEPGQNIQPSYVSELIEARGGRLMSWSALPVGGGLKLTARTDDELAEYKAALDAVGIPYRDAVGHGPSIEVPGTVPRPDASEDQIWGLLDSFRARLEEIRQLHRPQDRNGQPLQIGDTIRFQREGSDDVPITLVGEIIEEVSGMFEVNVQDAASSSHVGVWSVNPGEAVKVAPPNPPPPQQRFVTNENDLDQFSELEAAVLREAFDRLDSPVPELYEAGWNRLLNANSIGLNFSDPDDREIFRSAVSELASRPDLPLVKQFAKNDFGIEVFPNSTLGETWKMLAHAYMRGDPEVSRIRLAQAEENAQEYVAATRDRIDQALRPTGLNPADQVVNRRWATTDAEGTRWNWGIQDDVITGRPYVAYGNGRGGGGSIRDVDTSNPQAVVRAVEELGHSFVAPELPEQDQTHEEAEQYAKQVNGLIQSQHWYTTDPEGNRWEWWAITRGTREARLTYHPAGSSSTQDITVYPDEVDLDDTDRITGIVESMGHSFEVDTNAEDKAEKWPEDREAKRRKMASDGVDWSNGLTEEDRPKVEAGLSFETDRFRATTVVDGIDYDGFRTSTRITDLNGNHIGIAERTVVVPPGSVLTTQSAQPYVYNRYFSINSNYRGQGIGTEVFQHLEDYWRTHGITHMKVGANLNVGGYAWARAGYDWDKERGIGQITTIVTQIQAVVSEYGDEAYKTEVSARLQEIKNTLRVLRERGSWDLSDVPTPFELSETGRLPGMSMWPGKQGMLGSGWGGVKDLTKPTTAAAFPSHVIADIHDQWVLDWSDRIPPPTRTDWPDAPGFHVDVGETAEALADFDSRLAFAPPLTAAQRIVSPTTSSLLAAVWNPDLHPRGRDGRFIEKLGWVNIFDLSDTSDGTRGEVTEITPDPDSPGRPDITIRTADGRTVTAKPENLESGAPTKARLNGPGVPSVPDAPERRQTRVVGDESNPIGVPTTAIPGEPGSKSNPIRTSDVEEAATLLHQGKHVELETVEQVSTLLDRLAEIAQEAEAAGAKAPNYDLCLVSVPKTNLFCAESKGVPRIQMPQMSGLPEPGSPADRLPKKSSGSVDISDLFVAHLRAQGINVLETRKPAAFLKASQSELVGVKVAGMMKAMKSGNERAIQGIRESSIFVTSDGYVVDGHHRWAAVVGLDAADGGILGDLDMPVRLIDMSILDVLEEANMFARRMGIKQKGTSGIGAAALILLAAIHPYWNPDLHPRGRDGRFIEKWGIVELFGLLSHKLSDGRQKLTSFSGSRGEVHQITPDPSQKGNPFIEVGLPDGSTAIARPGQVTSVDAPIARIPEPEPELPTGPAAMVRPEPTEPLAFEDLELDEMRELLFQQRRVQGDRMTPEQRGTYDERVAIVAKKENVTEAALASEIDEDLLGLRQGESDQQRFERQVRYKQRRARRAAYEINRLIPDLDLTDYEQRYSDLDAMFRKFRGGDLDTQRTHDLLGKSRREWTPERKAMHEQMWQDFLAGVEAAGVPKGRDVFALGGLPGAGKTWSLKPGAPAGNFRVSAWEPGKKLEEGQLPWTHAVVNPDVVKDLLIDRGMTPEGVDAGMKPMEQALYIHEESSEVSKMFMMRLAYLGYNIVLDNTMDTTFGMEKRLVPLSKLGYRHRALFVDITPDESRVSAKGRYIEDAGTVRGGRFVPSSIVSKKDSQRGNMSRNTDNFHDLVTADWFDQWMIIDNTGVSQRNPRRERTGEGTGKGAAAERLYAEESGGVPLIQYVEVPSDQFVEARDQMAKEWQVYLTPHPASDFGPGKIRPFLSEDGTSGFAISPSGEIANVFNRGGPKGAGAAAVLSAIDNGGTWTSNFDGRLYEYYSKFGFNERDRLTFDDQYAPSGWDYLKNDRPDVLEMEKPGDWTRNDAEKVLRVIRDPNLLQTDEELSERTRQEAERVLRVLRQDEALPIAAAATAKDTPAQAALKAEMDASLRVKHGEEWMVRHQALLDDQWEYLKQGGFL